MNQRSNNDFQARKAQEERALMVVHPPRLPMPKEAAAEGLSSGQWKTLVEAVFPSAKSVDGVLLAVNYAKSRGLDIFKRVVHVVPMWNSKLGREVETVWPGIGELRTTASRTGKWAGNDDIVFGRMMRQSFSERRETPGRGNNQPRVTEASCPELDFPEWAQLTVYKIVEGVRVPFVGPKVFFTEIFSGEKGLRVPNARWRQAPRNMLEKTAEAAALRRAFPEELAGEYAAEEMEGKTFHADSPSEAGEAIEANYTDVGDRGTGEQTAAPQTRDLRGWSEERLASYMDYMLRGIERVKMIADLDMAMKSEEPRVQTLPDEERAEIDRLVKVRRKALSEQAQRDDDDVVDGEITEEPEQDPAPQGEEQAEPAYVTNLRKRVAEIEFVVDLDKLVKVEQRPIDNLPAWAARVASRIIADKREALAGPQD